MLKTHECRIFGEALALTLASVAAVSYAQSAQHYTQTNLVSDMPGVAAVTDPNLVNCWGLSRSSTSPWWVSDNGTGVATLYSGTGSIRSARRYNPSIRPAEPSRNPDRNHLQWRLWI